MSYSFHDVRFPEDVSEGSTGGPEFKTQIFHSYRGYEKRNIEWAQPLMRYNVGYGIRTEAQMQAVVDFFNARQGMLNGFRYKDWSNYNVVNGEVALGDGSSTRLSMYKKYGSAGNEYYKRLYKIVPGTVTGVTNNAVSVTEGVDFTIDYNSGEIIFTSAPSASAPIEVAYLEFDEPVRFETDDLSFVWDAFNSGSVAQLSLVGYRGEFTEGSSFAPGGTPSGTDPYYAYTTLLLLYDDADGATTTTDHSTAGQTVTFTGTAAVSRASFRDGLGSLVCGTGGNTVPGTPMQMEYKPFTIEIFARKPSTGSDEQPMVSQWDETNSQRAWTLRYNKVNEWIEFVVSDDGVTEYLLFYYPWDPVNSNYYTYITVDRMLNGWYVLRIDGEVVQSVREHARVHPSTAVVSVGVYADTPSGVGPFQGNIDSVRVTAGQHRHKTFGDIDVPTSSPAVA